MLPGNALFAGDLDDSRCKVLKAIPGNLRLLHSAMNVCDVRSRVDQLRGHEPAVGRRVP